MSDTAEPRRPFREHFGADATPATASTRCPAGAGKTNPFNGLGLKAAARAAATPRLTRVIGIAFVGLSLGGVCGLWLHARLAAASLPARLGARPALVAQHLVNPSIPSAAAPEPTPDGHNAPAASHPPAASAPDADAPLSAELPGTPPALPAVESRGEERAATRDKEARAAGGSTARENAPAREGTTPAASVPKPAKAARGTAPCAIYASASSLNVRPGASVPLILGGQSGRGAFTVTTPDWSDIAVFSEGSTAGGKNGWTRYAVRSVSKRAGVYTVHVKSPCDSQAIRVRVTPP